MRINLWLGLDLDNSVAQLVRALHRNRRAAGSIPVGGPTVAFFAAAPGIGLNKCIKCMDENLACKRR